MSHSASPRLKKWEAHDYGLPEYLDGAKMQFCVTAGPYPNGRMVAYVGYEPHARLIAAAPDLLEALRNLIALAKPHFSDEVQALALNIAYAAIAKAEGQVSEANGSTSPPHRKRYRRMNKDDEPVADATLGEAELAVLFGETIPMEAVSIVFGGSPDRTVAEVREELRALAAKMKSTTAIMASLERLATLSIFDPATGTSCIATNLEADLRWIMMLLRMTYQGREASGSPTTENEALGCGSLK